MPSMAKLLYSEFRIKNKISIEVNSLKDSYFYYPEILPDNAIIYSLGVGANINFELTMLEKCNSNVFCFDPTAQSRDFIENIMKDLPENFSFSNIAVGGEDGKLVLSHLKKASKKYLAGTLLNVPGNYSVGENTVPVKRIETLMKEMGHSKIDLIKMDIEGAEYEVIKDIIKTNIRPAQIALEFHPHLLNYKAGKGLLNLTGWRETAECISLMNKAGYSLCYTSKRGDEFLFVHNIYLSKN